MKKNILVLSILLSSLSVKASDHYYVAAEASQRVAVANGTFCGEDEDKQIVDSTVDQLKPNVISKATENCKLLDAIIRLPNPILIQEYKTKTRCLAFGSLIEITVSAVFECTP